MISGFKQSVFEKTEQVTQAVAYQDTRVAAGFLVVSGVFYFAAITALPFILISPGSFNMYSLFGSLNLQAALAFWYGPLNYVKSLFEPGKRLVSACFLLSTLMCMYIIMFSSGYILSLVGIFI